MRHIIWLLIYLFASQSGAMTPLTGEKLQKALSPYQSSKSRKARFEQIRTLKRWNTEIKTSGLLTFTSEPKAQVIWEIEKPEYTALKLTQQGLAVKGDKKSTQWKAVDNPQFKKQISPLFSWLSFDSQKISELYEVFLVKNNQFKLVPKDKKSPLKSIKIAGQNGQVKLVTLLEKSDDEIHIRFENLESQ